MSDVAATVSLPIYLRVGDDEEHEVGTITADSAAGLQLSSADLLRAVADEIERLLGAAR